MEKPKYPGLREDSGKEEYNFRILHYELDENGNYYSEMRNNWGYKEITNQRAWDTVFEKMEETRQDYINGKVSPIAFHMVRCVMDEGLLSKFVGFSKFRIRRHMKPKVWNKLSNEVKQKYATAFECTMEQLVNL